MHIARSSGGDHRVAGLDCPPYLCHGVGMPPLKRSGGPPPQPRLTPEPPPISGARWIALTRGAFALIDETDAPRVTQYAWSLRPTGRERKHLRAVAWVDGKHMYLHHFIMGARERVDHVNGDGLDNRRGNLRFASRAENQRNARVRSNSGTQLKGVHLRSTGLYRAYICPGQGKKIHLGQYADPKDAARAYNEAALRLFGQFARLNGGV